MTLRWNELRLFAVLERLAAQREDGEAWRDLYDCLWRFVVSITIRRLRDPSAAEDAGQEAFLRIARYYAFEDRHPPRVFVAYLARVAENTARDLYRRGAKPEFGQGERLNDLVDRETDVEQQVIIADSFRRVVESLDSSERAILSRLLSSGIASTNELADELNISYGNAAVRLHRLRKKIRSLLR